MSRRSIPLLAGVMIAALAGCNRPVPRTGGGLESPPPAPPAPSPWKLYTDEERLVDVAAGPGVVWAVSQNGVLSWTRPGGQVSFATGAGAPGSDAVAVAVATSGTVYVGLNGGIAWRRSEPGAQWERLTADPLHAGVTALAPRRAGGVWVGLQRGLGWMQGGRLRLHSRAHTVRDLAVDDAGRVWAATARNGLVTLEGDRIVEHTSVSGLCGNEIRAVATGEQGQVAVVCATPQPTVAFRMRNAWHAYTLTRGGAAIQDVQWQTGGWVIRASGNWWRVVERPAGTPYGVDDPPARLEPMSNTGAPPPPLPAAPSAAAVAAAPPVAPPPVEELILPRSRVEAREVGGGPAPDLRLIYARPQLPEDLEVTVWRVDADGFAWYGLPWRGLLGQKGQSVQRYSSQSLVPRSPVAQLAVDSKGRALIPTMGPYVLRFDGNGWERRPIAPADAPAQALAATADKDGAAWVLIGYPPVKATPTAPVRPLSTAPADPAIDAIAQPEVSPTGMMISTPTPEIALVRLEDARLQGVTRQPVLGIEGPLQVGHFRVGALGEAVFALFFENERGQVRGAGLGRIPVSHDRFERWPAARVVGETSTDGIPLLPDAWINALVRDPEGVLYLGTNAGLVRADKGQLRVFDENDFIDSEVITALARDGQGRIWAGHLEGLGRLEGDAWSAVEAKALRERITALAFDAQGRLWAGTSAGVWLGDGKAYAPVFVRPGDTPRDVRTIAHAPDGSVWLLTGQGIWHRPAGR
ncbi:MAG: hypothetical protein H6705_19570 [Myxococcales bacterium]|nr:hypothetical protein [Myxococcales bacterium]